MASSCEYCSCNWSNNINLFLNLVTYLSNVQWHWWVVIQQIMFQWDDCNFLALGTNQVDRTKLHGFGTGQVDRTKLHGFHINDQIAGSKPRLGHPTTDPSSGHTWSPYHDVKQMCKQSTKNEHLGCCNWVWESAWWCKWELHSLVQWSTSWDKQWTIHRKFSLWWVFQFFFWLSRFWDGYNPPSSPDVDEGNQIQIPVITTLIMSLISAYLSIRLVSFPGQIPVITTLIMLFNFSLSIHSVSELSRSCPRIPATVVIGSDKQKQVTSMHLEAIKL